MAIAIDSGRATMATVRPAMASARKLARPYPSRSTVISFGVKRSANPGAAGPRLAAWVVMSASVFPSPCQTCGNVGPCPARRHVLQPDAAPLALARRFLADQLDAGAVERIDDLDQAVDHAAHIAAARFHP